MRTQALLH